MINNEDEKIELTEEQKIIFAILFFKTTQFLVKIIKGENKNGNKRDTKIDGNDTSTVREISWNTNEDNSKLGNGTKEMP